MYWTDSSTWETSDVRKSEKGEKYVEFLLNYFNDPTETRTGFVYFEQANIERLKENKPNLVRCENCIRVEFVLL